LPTLLGKRLISTSNTIADQQATVNIGAKISICTAQKNQIMSRKLNTPNKLKRKPASHPSLLIFRFRTSYSQNPEK